MGPDVNHPRAGQERLSAPPVAGGGLPPTSGDGDGSGPLSSSGHAHAHIFVPYGPSRRRSAGFSQTFGRCSCGLRERRRYRSGTLRELGYGLEPGEWVSAAELAMEESLNEGRPGVPSLPVRLCRCDGQGCYRCGSLGVVTHSGGRIE